MSIPCVQWVLCAIGCWALHDAIAAEPTAWRRHTIDQSSRGADGARLADVNGDRLLDIATGWEEGGVIRVCLHPGVADVRQPWPSVTVGKVASPEDAVLVDLDQDGDWDVVSCCEGKNNTMFIHWAPTDKTRYLDAAAWTTAPLPVSRQLASWMFCLPLQVDAQHGPDLMIGAKGSSAKIGWFQSPENPRDLSAWKWHPLYDAGWMMSLEASDMDGDGDIDVLASDRKGPNRGCLWLENPGAKLAAVQPWPARRIGDANAEVMFLDQADLDGDGLRDVIVATSGSGPRFHRRLSHNGQSWQTTSINQPENSGTGKSVRVADIDLDGKLDLVLSCENAIGDKSGVVWLSAVSTVAEPNWRRHEISGSEGVKFDLLQLVDLDRDGDLDVITCEERENLGLIWYENPRR